MVSGGASGIGRALAGVLGKQGASVVIADADEAALEQTVAAFSTAGIEAIGRKVDLRDRAATTELASQTFSLGTVETVCLNAGVSYSGPTAWETPASAWDFVFSVNFFALVNQVAAFVPRLIAQGNPADLVITASMAGTVGLPTSAAYAASKAAAVSLAKSLRGELRTAAPFLRLAVLNPGMVQTNLQRTSSALQPADVPIDREFVEASHSALNSLGARPEDVATWTRDALDSQQFWVFPPPDDPFLGLLREELSELQRAVGDANGADSTNQPG